MVKHPEIEVRLSGTDGNVFALLGCVTEAMRRGGVPADDIKAVREELFDCGSYDDALALFQRTVVVS